MTHRTSLKSLGILKTPPTSRATSPVRPVALPIFEPGTAEVLPSESVLLPAQKTTSYLDDALTALGLHTEARTSFITCVPFCHGVFRKLHNKPQLLAPLHHEAFTHCPSICPSDTIRRCSTDGGHAKARRCDSYFHDSSWAKQRRGAA